MFKITTTWTNNNPDTIYNKLAAKLGREPKHDEVVAELNRIMNEVTCDLAAQGKLKHQRGRI